MYHPPHSEGLAAQVYSCVVRPGLGSAAQSGCVSRLEVREHRVLRLPCAEARMCTAYHEGCLCVNQLLPDATSSTNLLSVVTSLRAMSFAATKTSGCKSNPFRWALRSASSFEDRIESSVITLMPSSERLPIRHSSFLLWASAQGRKCHYPKIPM